MSKHLWVIEVLNYRTKRFIPIDVAFHQKTGAISAIKHYQRENPRATYRPAKYVRKQP